jgi:hypothetical protein
MGNFEGASLRPGVENRENEPTHLPLSDVFFSDVGQKSID